MQLLNAMVALGNDRNNMFFKKDMTPIEIVLLQQLHGADAVTSIEPAGDVERDPHEEITRLRSAYPMQHARVTDLWRDWPGDRFPQRLSHINVSPALLKPAEASQPYAVSAKPEAGQKPAFQL